MIKVNVEINNKSWHKKIKDPEKYFDQKLKKISKIVKFFKKKKYSFYYFTDKLFKYEKA